MINKLAEEIHNIWVKWSKSIMKEEKLSPRRRRRWLKCFVPYSELSEYMKEKDRKIARQLLKTIKEIK